MGEVVNTDRTYVEAVETFSWDQSGRDRYPVEVVEGTLVLVSAPIVLHNRAKFREVSIELSEAEAEEADLWPPTECGRCGRHPTEEECDGYGPTDHGWLDIVADGEVCPDCGTALERALDKGES
jgi:hypothetical protein